MAGTVCHAVDLQAVSVNASLQSSRANTQMNIEFPNSMEIGLRIAVLFVRFPTDYE
jgi:hypothetical protein